MDEVIKYQYWASLVLKERLGTISDSEAKELAEWIAADAWHKQLYERVKARYYARDIEIYRGIDVESGLKKYNDRFVNRKKRLLYRWISAAAIVTILLGSGMLLFYQQEPRQELRAEIFPGMAKAELVLGDGSVRQLEQAGSEDIVSGQAIINNTGVQIEYISGNDSPAVSQDIVPEYNELRIPIGGEYRLVMSDGTKVWLNSQSRLRYPVNFTGQERVVYLEGEAYFEVAHDVVRPFYVKTREAVNIQVLGTSFNVRAYGDEETIEAVLEKGKIRMWHKGEGVVLEPGSRAAYNRNNTRITSEPVNTELYTAWREGQFVFQGESVENILQKLSRWYGMNIFFSDEEAKKVLFSGDVRKYETINNLLEAIEISGGVHFEIKGNTIFVSISH